MRALSNQAGSARAARRTAAWSRSFRRSCGSTGSSARTTAEGQPCADIPACRSASAGPRYCLAQQNRPRPVAERGAVSSPVGWAWSCHPLCLQCPVAFSIRFKVTCWQASPVNDNWNALLMLEPDALELHTEAIGPCRWSAASCPDWAYHPAGTLSAPRRRPGAASPEYGRRRAGGQPHPGSRAGLCPRAVGSRVQPCLAQAWPGGLELLNDDRVGRALAALCDADRASPP